MLIPLLKVYTAEVDAENFAMLTTKTIFELKTEEYQQLFLKVFHFHIAKVINHNPAGYVLISNNKEMMTKLLIPLTLQFDLVFLEKM